MSLGDQIDFIGRLRNLLPIGWFPDGTEQYVLGALLTGDANLSAFAFKQLQYIFQQQRIQTATDVNLDIIAQDYFGAYGLLRRTAEVDNSYRFRIQSQLLAPGNTRTAINQALGKLTGYNVKFFEPQFGPDTGYYNQGSTLAYNVAGGYGSFAIPGEFFVTIFAPLETGIPILPGYWNPSLQYNMPGGYGVVMEYIDLTQVISNVTDQDIYNLVALTKSAGTIAWVNIVSQVNSSGYANPYQTSKV